MTYQQWILSSPYSADDVIRRMEAFVSDPEPHRSFLTSQSDPRVKGARVAPETIPVVASRAFAFGVKWYPYPPPLTGDLRMDSFTLWPTQGTSPQMTGWIQPHADHSVINLTVELEAESGMVAVVGVGFALAWVVFTWGNIRALRDGEVDWSRMVPSVLIPLIFGIAFAIWKAVERAPRQYVQLMCDVFDAQVEHDPGHTPI